MSNQSEWLKWSIGCLSLIAVACQPPLEADEWLAESDAEAALMRSQIDALEFIHPVDEWVIGTTAKPLIQAHFTDGTWADVSSVARLSSSDSSVIQVNPDGSLTSLSGGRAVITSNVFGLTLETRLIPCGISINEFQVAGANGSADEYVELFNSCAARLPLANHRLIYRSAQGTSNGTLVSFNTETIQGRWYFVAAGQGVASNLPRDGRLNGGARGALSAAGGSIALTIQGTPRSLDAVGYGTARNSLMEGTPIPLPSLGLSLHRQNNGFDTNQNASDFVARAPTPRG